MTDLTVEAADSSGVLELASNNDVEGFKRLLRVDASKVNEVGLWYGRKKGSRRVVLQHRTPLMIAATYGSLDVLRLIVIVSGADINFCGVPDKCTALHCAASGGSLNAVEVVRFLSESGADLDAVDANGFRPFDVIVVPPKLTSMRALLEELLRRNSPNGVVEPRLRISITKPGCSSPPLSFSPANGSPSSPSESLSSPMISKSCDLAANPSSEKKEYPIDPSFPDIKNCIYATDEFRMFSFKIRHCSRAYSHDWTDCPFVHPGENARRRDPRKYHYSCVPCPDFKKSACRRGDMCEYAHGVFECWLHPAQYRTRLCKDGTSCDRRVCFFAHTAEELRPLYVSTGSAVPSPRASASGVSVMDMSSALNILPGSPSSSSVMCPSPFSLQPMSPPMNGITHANGAWPQPSIPTLHLSGCNLQSSRLRASVCARDIPPEDFGMLSDFDLQQLILDDLNGFSQPWPNLPLSGHSSLGQTLVPSNLDDLFSSEITSSPRLSDQSAAVFSPTHKSAILNQFQVQQHQSMLSPINTNIFSPRSADHPLLHSTLSSVSSPGRMSPRATEPISPLSSRMSALDMHEKQHKFRCLSARDLGPRHTSSMVGSPVSSWSNWGSQSRISDGSVNTVGGMGRLRRSSSSELLNHVEEPDLSWIQSLVKESPPETIKEKLATPAATGASATEILPSNVPYDSADHSGLGAFLEQMHINRLLAQ
ncbi:hypothetical protein Dimus_023339 [Dionaea muscipula]